MHKYKFVYNNNLLGSRTPATHNIHIRIYTFVNLLIRANAEVYKMVKLNTQLSSCATEHNKDTNVFMYI